MTVQSGSEVYFTGAAVTFYNTFNIAGNGWPEPGHSNVFAAMRLATGAQVAGPVNLLGDAWLSEYDGGGDRHGQRCD